MRCRQLHVDDGFIELDGEDITHMPEHKRSLMVGLFQDPLKGNGAGHDDRRKSCLASFRWTAKRSSFSCIKKDKAMRSANASS